MKARARNKSNGETVFRTSGNSEKYHPRERRMRRNGRATRGAHRGALAYLLSSYAVRYARVRPANSCKALSCWRRAYVSPPLTIPTSLQIYVSFIARDSRRDSSTWSNYRASTGPRLENCRVRLSSRLFARLARQRTICAPTVRIHGSKVP